MEDLDVDPVTVEGLKKTYYVNVVFQGCGI